MSSQQSPKGGQSSSGATGDTSERLSAGSLVFAKMKSFPPWPAKIVSIDEYPRAVPKNHVPVRFLGSGEFGHVAIKECFPYAEYRDQYGSPKQRPKHAEAIREAEELFNSQQKQQQPPTASKKRGAPKGQDKGPTAPPSAKKARGNSTKSKRSDDTAGSSAMAHHDDEDLPASQLDEIAASTIFDDTHTTGAGDESKDGEEDEEFVDPAIDNVVRQLEELEQREKADKQRGHESEETPSTEPKRGRGRPPSKKTPIVEPPMESTKKGAAARASHQRSMSETTDDGNGSSFGRQLSTGDDLGKRRHKPKVMSNYFLEYDYGSPRAHRKSESASGPAAGSPGPASSATATATTPTSAAPAPLAKSQSKATKTTPAAASAEKTPAKRGRKPGSSKVTKDLEKAALESDIERVKLAAEANPEQNSADSQYWQRQHFGGASFGEEDDVDDRAFEFTVNVEETPSGGEAATTSKAAAKRRRDAAEMVRERQRQKHKGKLKVKLLKELLPAPKEVGVSPATEKKKKKSEKLAALLAKKKKAMTPGKIKVKMAKKRATKAAKMVAAAELKAQQKKRGRKPSLEKKLPKHEKRISGYILWSEPQIPVVQQEHPEFEGKLRQVHEILKPRFHQLPEAEQQAWNDLANREKAKRLQQAGGSPKKSKLQTPSSASSMGEGNSFYGRMAGTSTSPKGTPSSSRMYVMSPQHHGSSPSVMDIHQQQQMGYEQGGIGDQHVYQLGDASFDQSGYGSGYGAQHDQGFVVQAAPATQATPGKRGRGRPPKNPLHHQFQQKILPRPQLRLNDSSSQQGASALGYQPMVSPQKGLKAPKKETPGKGGKQSKQPLKILTSGQPRPPFQVRSPTGMRSQGQIIMGGGMDEPPVPEAMSHEELVYDSETAAMAAAAAVAMDMGNAGMMIQEGGVDHYGHVDPREQHELAEEAEAAVSFLTTDQLGSSTKSKGQLDDSGKKRSRAGRPRGKKTTPKEQRKPGQPMQMTTVRGQIAAANQFDNDPNAAVAFEDQSAVTVPPVAYEETYVEPKPTEEETNMFFFGTTQDVSALLEVRNTPAAMESQCRWWLADEADPELLGVKNKARGTSPPRPLTAEPLDAAAVFKLIGRTFENVGNQLSRDIDTEETPHEAAASMDMLLDGLVSSIGHLLTLTGSIPPFDRRYRRDVAARLVEDTCMMLPL